MFGKVKAKSISAKEAKALIDQGGAQLVDVRTPQEYKQGYIAGAISLPLDKLPYRAEQTLPDKEAAVILYCLSGARSGQAAMLLVQMGYKNVRNLGSINRWPYGYARG